MNDRSRGASRIAQPVKTVGHRVALIGLIVASVSLMIFGKIDTVVVERARTLMTDTVAPILSAVSQPVDSVSAFAQRVEGLWGLHEENQRLREQNARLIQWQAVARKLDAENQSLRQLLNYADPGSVGFVTARVIADTGGAFAHSLLVNAGSRVGISKGQAVVTSNGLVGRISGVGNRSARVLLVTDLSSRIPVVVEPGRARAILAGDNTDRPRLTHLAPGAAPSLGDLVVTSGHGGVFPVGLPVGVISSIGENDVTIKPFVDRDRLEVVRIVDYGLAGILSEEKLEERPITAQPVTDGHDEAEPTSKAVSTEALPQPSTAGTEP